MKSSRYLYLGIKVLFFVFVDISSSDQFSGCQLPNVPLGGGYSPEQSTFQLGDKVTYKCTEGLTLMGKDTSSCKSNGGWTNPAPFCDLKSEIGNIEANFRGRLFNATKLSDDNTNTCFPLRTGDSIQISLEKPKYVYALRIFLKTGDINIVIHIGSRSCSHRDSGKNQWVLIPCSDPDTANPPSVIKIQDKSAESNYTLCEVQVYAEEEQGCVEAPETSVYNGHFVISRSLMTLLCQDGYKSDMNSNRHICEKNAWVGRTPQCIEIQCSPVLDFPVARGSEWKYIGSIENKISAGTRRKLECSEGYILEGSPDTIVCQKNGNWMESNATCIEKERKYYEKKKKAKIIILVAGVIAVVIILSLLITTIYFVKKQRREVVVVYKPPTEGSAIESEAEYASASIYYESIQNTTPQPPTSLRPTVPMLSHGYFPPLDNSQKPFQSEIAFGTLKESSLYRC